MNRIILGKGDIEKLKGTFPERLMALLKQKAINDRMLRKLIEIVKKEKSFEEESLMYHYNGSDKDEIWSCMEFFYKHLYEKEFREFYWSDSNDEWENYHFQIKYKDHLSSVEIFYGIGSFCVIKPTETVSDRAKVLNLENLHFKVNGDIVYYAD